jgi:hypothetical protein
MSDRGDTYRAVLDGCAITLRALCCQVGVSAIFTKDRIPDGLPSDPDKRHEVMMDSCVKAGKERIAGLAQEEQRCLLEVLYLANRAVAHPQDGELDHKVGRREMTTAINTLLQWLTAKRASLSGLELDLSELLRTIPIH